MCELERDLSEQGLVFIIDSIKKMVELQDM